MLLENYFLISQFKTFVTRYNGEAAHSNTAQALEFAGSFLTHI
jgi:hypothetical protein